MSTQTAPRPLTESERAAAQAAREFLDAAPKGAIVTDNGDGWPWVKNVMGTWRRTGSAPAMTSAEVVDWHIAALLDPDDDTEEMFAPVLMVPATQVPHIR